MKKKFKVFALAVGLMGVPFISHACQGTIYVCSSDYWSAIMEASQNCNDGDEFSIVPLNCDSEE